MKKKTLLSSVLACGLCLSLTACGGGGGSAEEDKAEQSSEPLAAESAAPEATPEPTPTPTPAPTPTPLPLLTQGQVTTLEGKCEFAVDFAQVASRVMPPQPASYYSYYDADAGKTYVDLCISYKNLETNAVDADTVAGAKLTYAGKYEFNGFSIIEEDNRGDFTYSNITSIDPLTTEYVHYLFEVPEDVGSSTGSLEVVLTISGQKYRYMVREGDGSTEADPGAAVDSTPSKADGPVAAMETVTMPGVCEFYVEFANLTHKVTPPQPASYYSYYEADNGKAYLDFCLAYTNLGAYDVDADEVMEGTLLYDGSYKFNGFSIIEEDSRGDFTYSNITSISPLATEYIHYLFEVPEEVTTDTKSISVSFTVEGHVYTFAVR